MHTLSGSQSGDHYIRFIGYAIPTGPEISLTVKGSEAYLGNEDQAIDITARIAILKNAVDTAKTCISENECINTVTNVFVAPEFFFHGVRGPYIYAKPEDDPLLKIFDEVTSVFNEVDYPNWTFIFGTVATAHVANIDNVFKSESVRTRNATVTGFVQQMENSSGSTNQLISNTLENFISECQDSPNVIVRDRAVMVSNMGLTTRCESDPVNSMTTEKYFLSREDFICWSDGRDDVVTEQMVGYDFIDLSNGDVKHSSFDKYAIFRQVFGDSNPRQFFEFGVEICLDHDDARLRSNLGLVPEICSSGGVQVQIIPSFGSAIIQANVVASENGFVFNCDGQIPLDSTVGVQQYGEVGSQFLYANYAQGSYGAHTQLAQVAKQAEGNDPLLNSATFSALPVTDVEVVPVIAPKLFVGVMSDYYAGGTGAIHVYGLRKPYSI